MQQGVDYVGIAVVFFCHDGQGNYLFSKRGPKCRDEHGRWDPGGGSIDFGDTAESTLKREIAEEYGTEVIESEFLGFRNVIRTNQGQKTHWVALDFRVLVNHSKVKNAEPHKFTAVEWFRLDKLPQPMHSQFAYALEKYRQRLI